ncbi:MAG: PTS sugar transporter subunit IIA [Gammaproteobacteria bacterium]|nr:PTS sugar transporter subunit IIA [Gammaproteobacteria bacterium]MCP5318383.1 PTS sugar transporter subunit IIA [Chromatiaceae bacterium]MCW5584892.1 PTS sugar transporter subunit IIA [Chromatiales bacterium]MCB1816850.1 PTS sugar transporter subunit IIA [Gammaproteobacteria bacterium]MCP5435775.1 PTS sugar transporter subunit IIA [Chromatiaceae bacterium]
MLPPGILELRNISVADPASSKKRVLEQAARLLAADSEEPAVEQIFERLLERERLGSTGLAGGVALPHARMPGIQDSRGAFLRLAEAIEFDALDGKPVDLVFALLVPEDANEEHLQLLSKLAATFNQEDLRSRLREADAEQALAILTGKSATHAA